MNFSDALNLLKDGKKLKRSDWNGKNQYIELVNVSSITPYDSSFPTIDDINCKCVAISNENTVQVGWVCSQADLLAEDWEVIH